MSQKVNLRLGAVRDLLLDHYGLTLHAADKIRGIYQIHTDQGCYSLKQAEELPDLPLVRDCLLRIRQNGFPQVPVLRPTLSGDTHFTHDGRDYYLDPWTDGYELPETLRFEEPLGSALAKFHLASRGMKIPADSPRHLYGKRSTVLEGFRRQLAGWRERAAHTHEYDRQALDFLRYRIETALAVIRNVRVSPDRVPAAVCHGSLHHRNILIDRRNRIWLIDFESLAYAERVFDVAGLVHYYALPHGWNGEIVRALLQRYQTAAGSSFTPEERRLFFSYLALPRRLHQAALRYFEEKPASGKRYEKLRKVIQWEWAKEAFLRADPERIFG